MSYHEATYVSPDHRAHPEIKEISNQLRKSQGDCLVENFVSNLPCAVYLGKQKIKVKELVDVWKGWSIEKQSAFLAKYDDIALLPFIEVDEQLIKDIMPYWDPSYRCLTFNQEDMTLTIEEYVALLRIVPPNPDKSFGKRLNV